MTFTDFDRGLGVGLEPPKERHKRDELLIALSTLPEPASGLGARANHVAHAGLPARPSMLTSWQCEYFFSYSLRWVHAIAMAPRQEDISDCPMTASHPIAE
jgi:hypothetical protein